MTAPRPNPNPSPNPTPTPTPNQEGESQLCALLGSSGDYVTGRIGRAMLPAARRPPFAVTLLEEEKEHKLMTLGPDGDVVNSTERLTLTLLHGRWPRSRPSVAPRPGSPLAAPRLRSPLVAPRLSSRSKP